MRAGQGPLVFYTHCVEKEQPWMEAGLIHHGVQVYKNKHEAVAFSPQNQKKQNKNIFNLKKELILSKQWKNLRSKTQNKKKKQQQQNFNIHKPWTSRCPTRAAGAGMLKWNCTMDVDYSGSSVLLVPKLYSSATDDKS